jgi:hypothetical protein
MPSVIFAMLTISATTAATPTDAISQASGAALQADARRALEILDRIDAAAIPREDLQFVSCMRERFGRTLSSERSGPNGVTSHALAIYRSYWHSSLTNPAKRSERERTLDASLRTWLGAGKASDLDALLNKRIEASGAHSLQGRTGLLRELMIWDKQNEQLIDVQLPEGAYKVKVVFLTDFESFGWSHYATCGRRATGGWATDKALYAVVPRYDSLDSEAFRVTFLGHETQHFADKARFENLQPWELEYRAKLTELALADRTMPKLLGKFIEDQSNDTASPHSFANRAVIRDMISRLSLQRPEDLLTTDVSHIRDAAKAMLVTDSARRVGDGSVKT